MARVGTPSMAREKREKRDDITVKIGRKVFKKAKMVAAYRDIPLAQYLTDLLDKPVDRDYAAMKKEMGEEEDER